MINPMDLTGKHIVVTGASSGIGAEIATHISRLGGRVSLLARNEDRLKKVMHGLEGKSHRYYLIDLMQTERIEDVVKNIFEEQGVFDGAVYSAGVSITCPFKLAKPEKLLKMATINYLSFFEFTRCVTFKKYRAKSMSIIGISSIASEKGLKGATMYCSTKSAMNGGMRAMASELVDLGIRVNNIVPGWVRTDMYDDFIHQLGEENIKKEFEMLQYIGKPLETIDIANAATFLLSDASRFITGTEMIVAGGYLT